MLFEQCQVLRVCVGDNLDYVIQGQLNRVNIASLCLKLKINNAESIRRLDNFLCFGLEIILVDFASIAVVEQVLEDLRSNIGYCGWRIIAHLAHVGQCWCVHPKGVTVSVECSCGRLGSLAPTLSTFDSSTNFKSDVGGLLVAEVCQCIPEEWIFRHEWCGLVAWLVRSHVHLDNKCPVDEVVHQLRSERKVVVPMSWANVANNLRTFGRKLLQFTSSHTYIFSTVRVLGNELELDFNGFFHLIPEIERNVSIGRDVVASRMYHDDPLVTEAAEHGRRYECTLHCRESLKAVELHGRYHPIR
mmetsp:Transcript_3198/g.7478  ORF Transcript_3198/g.7478 Transcript_3198/m.7478 type:complete len:302 (+) Transcript_3198:395-1300(+)